MNTESAVMEAPGTYSPQNLFTKIAGLLQTARQNVVRTVNQTMVYTYYEIGRTIVEDEQQGKERAEYGKQVLKALSKRLSEQFGKGFSERNLEQMRQFYLVYSISQKSSAELEMPDFKLSWSHYIKLMRIFKILLENYAHQHLHLITKIKTNSPLRRRT